MEVESTELLEVETTELEEVISTELEEVDSTETYIIYDSGIDYTGQLEGIHILSQEQVQSLKNLEDYTKYCGGFLLVIVVVILLHYVYKFFNMFF